MGRLLSVTPPLYCAIEAGGTKMVCGIGSAERGSLETARIETRDVETTVRAMLDFFEGAKRRHGNPSAIGIASFGPLDLDSGSPTYGRITTTPKPGWQGTDLPKMFGDALGLPVGIDTDVNAAAWAETALGAATGCKDAAYVTIGTGIGVGLMIGGEMVHGLSHPEGGHLLPRRHPAHEGFAGICPYHGDCLEGLASGPAIDAAWGGSLDTLPADHKAFAVEADYIGQLCAALILTVSPRHIVLGGGISAQTRLLPMIRAETRRRLAGYAAAWVDPAVADARITTSGCAEAPGLIGAYLLAERAATAGLILASA